MILSMTGFGSSRIEVPSLTIAVEAKTVNHRYLDLHIRLPGEFQALEPVVRKVVAGRLRRGRVDIFVKIELTRDHVQMEADRALIEAYVELLGDLKQRFPITGELTVESLSRLPGAITVSGDDWTPEKQGLLAENLDAAVVAALDQLLEMRQTEGQALVQDLEQRIGSIRGNLEIIRQGATALLQHYRESLANRVSELAPTLNVDSNRLEVEALLHAEKSDIAEEVTRMASHLDHFGEIIARGEEAGKRLDFLLQEMNREVTTILSKTSGLNRSGAALGAAAIEIKVEIDKLREQVQNIE